MSQIQLLEELSLNAWPALQQILYDGWLLRFAEGYTKRANSVNVVYPGRRNLREKVTRCEQIYRRKNLTPIFRITPLAPPDLDRLLANSGYGKRDLVSVRVRDLSDAQFITPSKQASFHSENWLTQEWLDHFVHISHLPLTEWELLAAILQNIAAQTCFAFLVKNAQVVSCGIGVLEKHSLGLFDIITAQSQRRQGYAQELIAGMIAWGKNHGATQAYLQVVMENKPALELYRQLGFEEVYQYYYRIKQQ
ncbi:MAG: GNAT family N-acetyltransferase [Cyanophyceae cyanobacterium]